MVTFISIYPALPYLMNELGVFYAELNEFFQRELAEEGYSGVEVRIQFVSASDINAFQGPCYANCDRHQYDLLHCILHFF